ncbi:hypothetical protein ASPZODRAFT_751038 [Penicilliopsis zonata CBS 506.65]|uniref:Major facilitator superfamily (MFS) profile domain-containing protein n=1 Tax=Penicilliopsis zonata CBS 506.65 TaxID=1073090 RepID=A0A1L9SAM5_9EURO|nr:hypothetical protein ASPZODRAFT_751038 [Penicilliopsis zonata CBS 506.65]OJJ44233.1 hypothetical protein ASPZODRAFT_751038 [Penicilliopsis zonata CBS 506.65]
MVEHKDSTILSLDQHSHVSSSTPIEGDREQDHVGHPAEQLEAVGDSQAPTLDSEMEYVTGAKAFALMVSCMLIAAAIGLDNNIVAIAVPSISDKFNTISDIGWYSSTLRLVMCSFMFLFGKAYTLYATKPLFIMSIGAFEAGNILATFSPTSNSFILGRAITGFGCAGIINGLFSMLTRLFPLHKRPLVGGLVGAVETLAGISAPLIGGALIDGWSWRACFGINVPLGLVGLAVNWFFLETPHSPKFDLPWQEKIENLDLLGTAVFIPMMTCLLLALEWGGITYSWSDLRIIACLVVFGVLFAVFAWRQYRAGDRATLPLRILRNRSIIAGAWFGCCINAAGAVLEYYLSIYFQAIRGYSAAQAGVYALPMITGLCVACIVAGAATSRIGYYVQFMYATTILSSIAAGLLTTIDLKTDLPKLLCLEGLMGFASGIGFQAPQVAAQTVLAADEATIGLSIIQFGQQLGPVLFLAASTTLFTNRLTAEVEQYSPSTNITSLENMGLSDIRKAFGGEKLEDVLLGYDTAVTQTLFLPVALTCVTAFGSLAMEWRSVKKKQQ